MSPFIRPFASRLSTRERLARDAVSRSSEDITLSSDRRLKCLPNFTFHLSSVSIESVLHISHQPQCSIRYYPLRHGVMTLRDIMPDRHFHYFRYLPLELREEIYRLSTPPRVVRIRQRSDEISYERFEIDLYSAMPILLHPGLAYFAYNWRHRIPQYASQPGFDPYGFTGAPIASPWRSSPALPAISTAWLLSNPELAWEFLRKAHFTSSTRIPPLLHVCVESRASLIRWGYELAYGTRSSWPRTWFNFQRDTLLLDYPNISDDEVEEPTILNSGMWDIGQLCPKDMWRVRRLALERGLRCIQLPSAENPTCHIGNDVESMIKLFGNLEGLQLVEWTECTSSRAPRSQTSTHEGIDRDSSVNGRSSAPEEFRAVKVKDVDALLHILPCKPSPCQKIQLSGDAGDKIRRRREQMGHRSQYFRAVESLSEQCLRDRRNVEIANGTLFSTVPWLIPKVTIVHMLAPSDEEGLRQERSTFIDNIRRLRSRWIATGSFSRPCAFLPKEDFRSALDRDKDTCGLFKARSLQLPADSEERGCGPREVSHLLQQALHKNKTWWISEGPIQALADEIDIE
jgi:hypothetical protein